MKKLLYILVILIVSQGYSQSDLSLLRVNSLKDSLFSEAVSVYYKKYAKEREIAFLDNDKERVDFLFDSLVDKCLKSKYFDDFKVRKLNGSMVSINKTFDKPVFLITYSSWCVTNEGELPAINALAEKHHDAIDFVILYWDNKSKAKKMSKNFNKHVSVVYIDETENHFSTEVANLKHTFGFPSIFLLDSSKRIMDIKNSGPELTASGGYINSYSANYNYFSDSLSTLIINGAIIEEHLAAN